MMVRLLLLMACLGKAIPQAAHECPHDWEAWGGQCYKFVFYPVRDYFQAFAACQTDSAHLLSVNSNDEHDFVSRWLTRHAINRDSRWWTSGVGGGQFLHWEGDGTLSTVQQEDMWIYHLDLSQQLDLPIVYSFTAQSGSFAWSRQQSSSVSSYVCEISQNQAFRILQARRDFTYGTNTSDPMLAPRGPRFSLEAESVVVVGSTDLAFLECTADSNPPADYIWYREEAYGVVAVSEVTDSRYSLTNGRWSIQHPQPAHDAGRYFCRASNGLGSIHSHSVSLAFGFLGEFSNDPPGSVRAFQYQGTYIQCNPPNYNPSLDYQWYKGPGAKFLRPDLNQHLFVSFNGRLYFSETQSSDAGFYHCLVTLVAPPGQRTAIGQAPSRASMGIELVVQGDVASEYGPIIHNDFPTVFPTPALRGTTLRLECFAYGKVVSRRDRTGEDNICVQSNLICAREYPYVLPPIDRERYQIVTKLTDKHTNWQNLDQKTSTCVCRLPLYYTWRRDNGPLPPKARLPETEHSRVLLIPDVQLHDSGNYTCRVERANRAFDEKSLALHVEAVPFFTSPPRDQHVDIRTTFTLMCQAVAVPPPTYVWFRDGQPLISDPNVIEVSGNVVTFFQADPNTHNGMYQCSASNTHGTRMSSAEVRVLEFQPNFSKSPVRSSQTATVGGNVTLRCQPDAAPAPTITWAHNERPLDLVPGSQGRLTLLNNGNLLIGPVQTSDQGRYTCTAENSKGSASSSGFLLVVTRAVLTTVPANTEVLTNDTAFLACQASYDPRHTDLTLTWTFNGFHLDTDHHAHYRQVQQDTQWGLYIINAQFQHSGVYQCNAVTTDAVVSRQAYLIVKGPPAEPAGLQGHQEENDVIIYWTEGTTHGSPVIHYVIEFNSNINPEWHVKEKELKASAAVSSLYPGKLSALLTDLSPGSNVRFRVRAVNQFGVSQPSLSSEYFQVPDSAPLVAPDGIRNKVTTVGTLSFEWDPLSGEFLTGQGQGYTVYWRKTADAQKDSIWHSASVDVDTTSFVTVVHLENYYIEYEVMVAAFNYLGQGPNSSVTLIMSQEDLPIATPQNVWGSEVNTTAVMVFWDTIDESRELMKGKLLGVQINYWWESDQGRMFSVNIYCPPHPEPCTEGMVVGLDPNDDYWVNLQVFNTAGLGPVGEDIRLSTLMNAPRRYPEYVSVHSMEGKKVYVEWRGISIGLEEEALKGYKLWVWPASENILTANVKVVRGRTHTWAVVEGLREGTLYALRVLGYSNGGDGVKSPTVYFTLEGQVVYNPETSEVIAQGTMISISPFVIAVSCMWTWLLHRFG